MMRSVDPAIAVHPLRLELDELAVRDFFRRIDLDDNTLTIDEIECAQDWLYDYIVSIMQTHEGITTLQ